MKILIIHYFFLAEGDPGGGRFNQFAKQWIEDGHEVTVIAGTVNYMTGLKSGRGWVKREKINDSLTVFRCFLAASYNKNFLGRIWSYFSFIFSALWAGIINAGKADIVIASSPPLFVAIPGYIISKFKKSYLIFEVRDLWPKFAIDMGILKNKQMIKISQFLERFIYDKADLINVLTPAYKDHILENKAILSEKIVYLPNAADLDMFHLDSKNNWVRKKHNWHNKFIFLYIGAHGPANDLRQIIEAAELLKDIEDIIFVFVGDGLEKKDLIELAKSKKLLNVEFLNAVNREIVVDYINASDVCMASLKSCFVTTFPNKVFDYMACGKPMLINIDGICRDLVVNQARAGIFANPDNPIELKEKILYLYNNPSILKEFGLNGYNFVKINYNRRDIAFKYLNYMKQLLNN